MLLALVLYICNMSDVGKVVNGLVCSCLFITNTKILQCNDLLKMPSITTLQGMLFIQTDNVIIELFLMLGKKEFFYEGGGYQLFSFTYKLAALMIVVSPPPYMFVWA